MDIHKNARLTLRSREALVETVIRGLAFSRAAASFHVTPKTAAKWVRRYQSEGAAGLRDRSSRPHRSPRATSSSQVGLVIELRRQHRPAFPGDLLHLDIKDMTRFQQVSWRGDGRRRGHQKQGHLTPGLSVTRKLSRNGLRGSWPDY